MTKAEELKLLEQIEKLLLDAGPDSYIGATFDGICDVCRRIIVDDFGDSPVNDLDDMRNRYDAEVRMHDDTKRILAEAQKECTEALDENERLRKLVAEWEQNAHDAGDLYCELEEECRAKSQEITRLRAEIMRMKFEHMTEFDLATMYEKMEGAK